MNLIAEAIRDLAVSTGQGLGFNSFSSSAIRTLGNSPSSRCSKTRVAEKKKQSA